MNEGNVEQTPKKCPYCGGGNIAGGVVVHQTADAGRIGLAYKTRFIVTGTEPLFADVCDDCGSLARIFVKTVGRKWSRK